MPKPRNFQLFVKARQRRNIMRHGNTTDAHPIQCETTPELQLQPDEFYQFDCGGLIPNDIVENLENPQVTTLHPDSFDSHSIESYEILSNFSDKDYLRSQWDFENSDFEEEIKEEEWQVQLSRALGDWGVACDIPRTQIRKLLVI